MSRIPPIRNPMPMPSRDIYLDLQAPSKLVLGDLTQEVLADGGGDTSIFVGLGDLGIQPNRRVSFIFGNSGAAADQFGGGVSTISGTLNGWGSSNSSKFGEFAFETRQFTTAASGYLSAPIFTARSSWRFSTMFMFPDGIPSGSLTNQDIRWRVGITNAASLAAAIAAPAASATVLLGVELDKLTTPAETTLHSISKRDGSTIVRDDLGIIYNISTKEAVGIPAVVFWYLVELRQAAPFGTVELWIAHSGQSKALVDTLPFPEDQSVLPEQYRMMFSAIGDTATAKQISMAWMSLDQFGSEIMGAPPIPMSDVVVPKQRRFIGKVTPP